MVSHKLRPAYMFYPGLFPLLMLNYWVYKKKMPIVAILISDYDIKHKGRILNFFEFLIGMIQECGATYTFYMLLVAKYAVPLVHISNFFLRLIGKKIKVKTYDEIAKEKGIPLYRSKDFNGEQTQAFLKNVNANIIVSAYNNQILKRVTFAVPKFKSVNIHPAYLPNFRGLDGPFEAMYHQVRHAGVTVHYVDSRIDTGKILQQKKVLIRKEDSLFSLSFRCWIKGASLLEDVYKMISSDKVVAYKQDPKKIKFPYRSFPSKKRIHEWLNRGNKLVTLSHLQEISNLHS